MAAATVALAWGCAPEPSVGGDAAFEGWAGKADVVLPDPVELADLSACPRGAPRLHGGREGLFTVMMYGAADNDLEEEILADVAEAARAYEDQARSVNVVAQVDVASEPGTRRFVIHGDDAGVRFDAFTYQDELNTGDPRNLVDFASWAGRCFPAERYALIVEGHGSPWSERRSSYARRARERAEVLGESVRLLAYDKTAEEAGLENPELSLADLRGALREIRELLSQPEDPRSHERLAIYGSDACLMQTVEVLYSLRNTALYVIGSADTEPGVGWPYNTLVRELTQNAGRRASDPAVLASHIVDRYERSVRTRAGDSFRETTLSAVRPIEMNRVAGSLGRVARLLEALLAERGADAATHIWASRREAYTFGDSYVDLPLFLDRLTDRLTEAGMMPEVGETIGDRQTAHALREAIRELTDADLIPDGGRLHDLLIRSRAGRAYPGAGGLSIYLPWDECAAGQDLDDYGSSEFAHQTGWHDFVRALLQHRAPPEIQTRTYYGRGTMTAHLDGERLQDAAVYCDLTHGKLDVYAEDPSLTLGLRGTFDGEAFTVTRVEADPGDGILSEWVEAPLRATFRNGLLEGGSVSLATEAGELTLELRCGDYERQACE